MSIRHLVLMRFHEGTDAVAIQALADGLRALPDKIPAIAAYQVGPDIGLADGNWDFAVSADFETVDDFHSYRAHPDHVAVIDELIQPHVAQRIAVQFDT
jgi:Stress responsive A/B Barrel Domain